MNETVIELRSVVKSFGNKKVLDGIDLSVQKGQTLVILGRSGCGKSVTLRNIIGLVAPDAGKVIVDAQDVNTLDARALDELRMQVGMVFQFAALFDSMNVGENVGFALFERSKLTRNQIADAVAQALGLVGLKGIEGMNPSELSGGMKKRVAIARAICLKPKIMLYDEPTTGLDPVTSDIINRLIIDMKQKLGVSSVVVTHDMNSAFKVADQMLMIHEGRVIAHGSPEHFKNPDNPIVRNFVLGHSDEY